MLIIKVEVQCFGPEKFNRVEHVNGIDSNGFLQEETTHNRWTDYLITVQMLGNGLERQD